MGNNNENRNRKPMTQQELLDGLLHPTIPIDPFGALYREKTSTLAGMVVDMFVNTFGIVETDHILMYPIFDKAKRVTDFNLAVFFNTKKGSSNWNIRKLSNDNNKRSGRGIDLRPFIGNRMNDGAFELSPHFNKVFSAIAEKDDDGNIIVGVGPYDGAAVIKCNFFEVIGICLGIVPSDNYDFSIADCKGINVDNNGVATDYVLTFTKEISINNAHHRGKNGFDYSRSDYHMMKNSNK